MYQRYRPTDRQTVQTTVQQHRANRFTNGRPMTLHHSKIVVYMQLKTLLLNNK